MQGSLLLSDILISLRT